jgi:hypothetical protein
MKNIHVLPTPKPSNLIHNVLGYGIISDEFTKSDLEQDFILKHVELIQAEFQNIHITSDKKIKEGNWVLGDYPDNPIGKVIAKYGKEYTAQCLNGNKCGLAQYDAKKIILTTDQDLIKDGVQPIDDTFLEWFIKNPSCEFVKIDLIPVNEFGSEITVGSYGFDKFKYKIIIPKEEPKQKTLEKAANNWIKNTSEFLSVKNGFIEGAKSDAAKNYWFKEFKQDKNKYSEEEVIQILINYEHYLTTDEDRTAEEWFEQFKKK